mgnify:CR=1 FL=1
MPFDIININGSKSKNKAQIVKANKINIKADIHKVNVIILTPFLIIPFNKIRQFLSVK